MVLSLFASLSLQFRSQRPHKNTLYTKNIKNRDPRYGRELPGRSPREEKTSQPWQTQPDPKPHLIGTVLTFCTCFGITVPRSSQHTQKNDRPDDDEEPEEEERWSLRSPISSSSSPSSTWRSWAAGGTSEPLEERERTLRTDGSSAQRWQKPRFRAKNNLG